MRTSFEEYTGIIDVLAGTFTLENNGRNTILSSGRFQRSSNLSIGLIRGERLGNAASNTTNTNWFMVDQGSGSTATG